MLHWLQLLRASRRHGPLLPQLMGKVLEVRALSLRTFSSTFRSSINGGARRFPLLSRDVLARELRDCTFNRFERLKTVNLAAFKPKGLRSHSYVCPKNPFIISTMKKIGGGESALLEQVLDYVRIGGGSEDSFKSLRQLDCSYKVPEFQLSLEETAARIGISEGVGVPYSLDGSIQYARLNPDANPGPTFSALGFTQKRECFMVASDLASRVVSAAEAGTLTPDYLKPRYQMHGRPKLLKGEEAQKRLLARKPLGRQVAMADAHEALVGGMYFLPMLNHLHEKMKVITNGFNKFGEDPGRVAAKLEKYNTFISGDFSMFDVTISPGLIRRGFDLVRRWYKCARGKGDKHDLLLQWIEVQFTDSDLVAPDGAMYRSNGGVKSGSSATALIDSLVCAVLWVEVLHRLGRKKYALFTHGDDNIIGLNFSSPHELTRKKEATLWLHQVAKLMQDFGMVMHPEKCSIGVHLYTGIVTPNVPERVLDGSRRALASYWRKESARLGRHLTFPERYKVVAEEPDGGMPGNTHRWSYLFKNRPHFLSCYFKHDQSEVGGGAVMVHRPLCEVIARLVHPESRVKTLNEHFMRLQAALVDNMGNHHVINHIMHYVYDAWVLRSFGVKYPKDLQDPKVMRLPRRAWYRRVDRVVNLLVEDLDFYHFWEEFSEAARRIWGQTYGSTYVSWQCIRAMRKGRGLNHASPNLCYPAKEGREHVTLEQLYQLREIGMFFRYSKDSITKVADFLVANWWDFKELNDSQFSLELERDLGGRRNSVFLRRPRQGQLLSGARCDWITSYGS